jgi:hypothetical protein
MLSAHAASAQQHNPWKREPVKSRFETKYDPAKDETVVQLEALVLIDKTEPGSNNPLPFLNEGLRLSASFTYPGKTFTSPKFVTLSFLSISHDKLLYEDGEELIVKVKDARASLGKLKVSNNKTTVSWPGRNLQSLFQILNVNVSPEDFNRIVNEKSVTFIIGKTSVKLMSSDLKALRELASRMTSAP